MALNTTGGDRVCFHRKDNRNGRRRSFRSFGCHGGLQTYDHGHAPANEFSRHRRQEIVMPPAQLYWMLTLRSSTKPCWPRCAKATSGDRVGCFASQLVGIGPQIGHIFPMGKDLQGHLNLKGYGEFANEHRPDGWNVWLTFVISPAPPAAASPKPMFTK
jgi:hypothetical protein